MALGLPGPFLLPPRFSICRPLGGCCWGDRLLVGEEDPTIDDLTQATKDALIAAIAADTEVMEAR